MRKIFIAAALLLTAVCACQQKPQEVPETAADANDPLAAKQDSMVYGLSCDGTNDSVIVFLPLRDGADPVTYYIADAKAAGKVIGTPEIGDWVGLFINPADTTEATMVIDLDQLKGTWTYSVRPVWKDAAHMSARALRRKLGEIPDSMKEAYMIPREYGFTLQRSNVARPVGHVYRASSLEEDSPVQYPPVRNYTRWKVRNGHLYLASTIDPVGNAAPANSSQAADAKPKEKYDTLDFVQMTADSLICRTTSGVTIHFHRRANAEAANAEAQKASMKTSARTLK